jgi:hypothetical protein
VFSTFKLAGEFTFHAMHNMPFPAPMVRHVALRIFHHSQPQAGELNGLPEGSTFFSPIFFPWNASPVNGLKWNISHVFGVDMSGQIFAQIKKINLYVLFAASFTGCYIKQESHRSGGLMESDKITRAFLSG